MNRISNRLILLSLAAVAAVSVFAILAPTASAVTPQFTIDTISQPKAIQPDLGSEDVTISWTYSLNTAGTEAIGGVAATTTLQWDPPACTGDNGAISVTGTRTQSVVLREGTSAPKSTVTGTSIFHLAATQDAPGERPLKCTFSGKVLAPGGGANNQITDSNSAPVEVNVLVKYLGLLTAEVPAGTIQEAGPQKEIRFDVKLTNLGNAQSNVRFSLVGDVPEGWLALPPAPTTIGSLQQGAPTNQNTVPFLVSTPYHNGWNNGDTSFQLRIQPESTKDQTPGNEVIIPVITRVRGIYVPGPEPMLLVAAILGAAMVTRLLRK